MRTYWGSRGTAPHTQTLALNGSGVVTFTPGEKAPSTHSGH